MANRLLETLKDRTLLCDGAMGTQIMAMGLEIGHAPESLNMTAPDEIKIIHQNYFDAGCRILETNTLGGSSIMLRGSGMEDKVYEYNFNGVRLAKEVVGDDGFVAASLGPTGQFIKPLGDVTVEELEESFQQQAAALIEGGADAVCVETMMDAQEAAAAIRGVKKAGDVPVLATMTFNPDKLGYRTMMGISPTEAAGAMVEAGADVIGVNCVEGPRHAVEIIREMKAAFSDLLFMAQPNAGLPIVDGGKTVYPLGPDEMCRGMDEILSEGVSVIGGCCGTTPQHLRLMAGLLDSA